MKIIKWTVIGLLLVLVGIVAYGTWYIVTLDIEEYRELIAEKAYQATGRELTLAGPMDLEISLTPTLIIEDVTLANAEWGSRAEMISFQRLEFQADLVPLLTGKLRIARLILIGPDILIETAGDGTGNWQFTPPAGIEEDPGATEDETAPTGDDAPRDIAFGVDELVILDGVFTYRNGQTGAENTIQLTRLEGSAPDLDSPIRLAIEAVVDGRAFALNGTVGAIEAAGDAPYPINLSIQAGGAEISVDGVIADLLAFDGLDLAVSIDGDQLSELGAFANSELPALSSYHATFQVRQSGSRYTLENLQAELGGSDLAGDATLTLGGARPSIAATLTSNNLTLAELGGGGTSAGTSDGGGGSGSGGGGGSSGGNSRYVFTEAPLPLDALNAVDADLNLTIGHLEIDDRLVADNVEVTLNLAGGRLRLSPLGLDFYGGRITSWADINSAARGTPVALRVDGDHIDYGRLLRAFAQENSFSGTVDLDADLTGSGNTMRAIASTLTGPLEIHGENGTIDNRWLKAVTGGFGDILGPLFGNSRSSALHCILLTTRAQSGIISVNGMALDSEVFTLYGGGIIDLRNEGLDLDFNSGTRAAAISSLVPPFHVGGTLKDPSVRPDLAGVISGAAGLLGGLANPQGALAALSGLGQDDSSAGQTVSGNACANALEEAARPAPASPIGNVTDIVEDAAGTLGDALGNVLEGADPSSLEDAAGEALEGLRGLFGR